MAALEKTVLGLREPSVKKFVNARVYATRTGVLQVLSFVLNIEIQLRQKIMF